MLYSPETLRLQGPRLHEALHRPVLPSQARQDRPRPRVLRLQAAQGQPLRQQRGRARPTARPGQRRQPLSAPHPEDAAQRVHYQVGGKRKNEKPRFIYLFFLCIAVL